MSSTGNPIQTASIRLAVDVADGYLVDYAGNLCAAGVKAAGAVSIPTLAGELAPVVKLGTWPVYTGGAFSAGDELQSDGAGRVVLRNTGKLIGYAGAASAAAGERVPVDLR